MSINDYLQQLFAIILALAFNIILPIIGFIPKLKKRDKFKMDGIFIGFLVTTLFANCLVAYLIGILGYVNFNDKPVRSYVWIWIISFFILCSIEILLYLLWMKQKEKATIEISMSPNDYKELILNAEKEADTIWLMPKRIHVMFKSEAFIHYLAVKRFGVGSEYIKAYEDEHIERKLALYRGLNNGLVIHELHNKDNLIAYIKKQTHSGVDNIEKKYFIEMLNEWKRILELYPDNYFVRLTDENLPLKYELINEKRMVMHESIGGNSRDRFNAILIESPIIVKRVSNDFSQIWERIDSTHTDNQYMIEFIDTELLPLLC